MSFAHEDAEFAALLQIVASAGPIRSPAMVEKDYWLAHALWALEHSGLEFYFKGGTSLSKAFGLIPRFSEDIDLVILPGRLELPTASSWSTETKGATNSRRQFWRALLAQLDIPGTRLEWDEAHDPTQRNIGVKVHYPGHFVSELEAADSVVLPYVLLEMSHGSITRSARAPSLAMPISSLVHDYLGTRGQIAHYTDNRPVEVQCVHPYVTLIEKLDAIVKKYEREDDAFEPPAFVRHYEDAARIIRHPHELEALDCSIADLALEMLARRHIRRLLSADEEAFALTDPGRRSLVEKAYDRVSTMYWEERVPFMEAVNEIRRWLKLQNFAAVAAQRESIETETPRM